MKRLKNLVLVFCAGLALSGCSYFGQEEGGVSVESAPQIPADMVDIMAPGGGASRQVQLDPAEVIARNTEGRVQVFGLDDAGATSLSGEGGQALVSASTETGSSEIAPVRAMLPVATSSSEIFSGDPSVQIFSLDGDASNSASFEAGEPLAGHSGVMIAGTDVSGMTIIYFGHDSHDLDSESLEKIARLSKEFDSARGQGINVEGHASVTANYADDIQRKIVNLKISMDRALAVSRELIKQGVPAEAIRVTAWGETRPPRKLDGKTPEEASRRVEVSS